MLAALLVAKRGSLLLELVGFFGFVYRPRRRRGSRAVKP